MARLSRGRWPFATCLCGVPTAPNAAHQATPRRSANVPIRAAAVAVTFYGSARSRLPPARVAPLLGRRPDGLRAGEQLTVAMGEGVRLALMSDQDGLRPVPHAGAERAAARRWTGLNKTEAEARDPSSLPIGRRLPHPADAMLLLANLLWSINYATTRFQ
jgi:hypothetical protein